MSVTSVNRLRDFANSTPDHNSCDLCRAELSTQHPHLLDVANGRMLCACGACSLLFSDDNGSRFRPIPRIISRISLDLSDDVWSKLGIPIGMAFFTVREQLGELQTDSQPPVTVAYPSPAGPVMSQVDGSDWQILIDANACIARMRTEVETLLINRTANRRQAFIVPLDVCFELVGIVRRHWQGWSGGTDVHREIDAFFERLESSAKELA